MQIVKERWKENWWKIWKIEYYIKDRNYPSQSSDIQKKGI